MPPVRDHYVIGRTGSFFVPTMEKLDAALRQLVVRLADAGPDRRGPLRHDIDRLLDRRHALTGTTSTSRS